PGPEPPAVSRSAAAPGWQAHPRAPPGGRTLPQARSCRTTVNPSPGAGASPAGGPLAPQQPVQQGVLRLAMDKVTFPQIPLALEAQALQRPEGEPPGLDRRK